MAVQTAFIPAKGMSQSVTNTIDASNAATSDVSPELELQQSGVLSNSQSGPRPLGKVVIGKDFSDCTTSGFALSVFGSGIGPFDSGALGGSVTYTESAGQETCKRHARSQLTRIKLETCLLLISNYSKMKKAGLQVSYEALKKASGVECPNLALEKIMPGAAITP